MGMDRIKTATWLSVVVLALNMVFYIVFIPDSMGSYDLMGLGSKGAAFALLASTAISTALFRYHAFKLTSSKPNWILILNSAVAVVVFWPLSYLIVYLDFMGNFLMLGSLFTIGFALYIGLLSIFGLFNRSDIVFYLETLNLRKLLVYVKGEVSN
jgi:hypothetical protein